MQTHVWQHHKLRLGLKEGMADFVASRIIGTNFEKVRGHSWDSGYESTASFLLFIEDHFRSKDFVKRLNLQCFVTRFWILAKKGEPIISYMAGTDTQVIWDKFVEYATANNFRVTRSCVHCSNEIGGVEPTTTTKPSATTSIPSSTVVSNSGGHPGPSPGPAPVGGEMNLPKGSWSMTCKLASVSWDSEKEKFGLKAYCRRRNGDWLWSNIHFERNDEIVNIDGQLKIDH